MGGRKREGKRGWTEEKRLRKNITRVRPSTFNMIYYNIRIEMKYEENEEEEWDGKDRTNTLEAAYQEARRGKEERLPLFHQRPVVARLHTDASFSLPSVTIVFFVLQLVLFSEGWMMMMMMKINWITPKSYSYKGEDGKEGTKRTVEQRKGIGSISKGRYNP